MSIKKDWSEYFEFTREKPPFSLLVEALKYVTDKDKAIDIGGGALRDTRYLLNYGFDVTVIDNSPLLEQEASRINNDKLHAYIVSFEDFNFPKNEYNLASAMFALTFCDPNHFDVVFEKIKDSLKPGGIFCGQLFGDRDKWSNNIKMTYPSKDRLVKLLTGFEVISFVEKETDDKDANDEVRCGHVFQFIVRK